MNDALGQSLGSLLDGVPGPLAAGIGALALLAAGAGILLAWLHRRLPPGADGDVERVNALLPQTQCGQCGYPGCRPYAAALVAGEAPVDRCPPGGETTLRALAALVGQPPPTPAWSAAPGPVVAWIDESLCVGCARCIEVCPVDAILGAHRHTHTVMAADCTGCGLCLPPCPVDCIQLRPADRPRSRGTLQRHVPES